MILTLYSCCYWSNYTSSNLRWRHRHSSCTSRHDISRHARSRKDNLTFPSRVNTCINREHRTARPSRQSSNPSRVRSSNQSPISDDHRIRRCSIRNKLIRMAEEQNRHARLGSAKGSCEIGPANASSRRWGWQYFTRCRGAALLFDG